MPDDKGARRPGLIGFIDEHLDWFLSGFVILVGAAIVYASWEIPKENVWHEVVRDIGIAFLIAAVVSVIYETFARSRFLRHTTESMLGEVFGNIVHPDVWKIVKDEVIRHRVMRESLDLHLALLPEFDREAPQMVLWLSIEYGLKGLHDSPTSKTLPLRHFLDDHICVGAYPRFDSIIIDDEPQPLDGVCDGVFETEIPLPHKHADAIRVTNARFEVTYVPGSYYLTMTELTKGIEAIHLSGLPDWVEAFVSIRPYKERVKLVKDIPLKIFKNTILLPGHSIEFRFKLK